MPLTTATSTPPISNPTVAMSRLRGRDFVHRCNTEHRHIRMGHFTPAQRHGGDDEAPMVARHLLAATAKFGRDSLVLMSRKFTAGG